MDDMTIGQLARRTGLPVRTLRFWSDAGVVRPVSRSAGGYRMYDASSVARVELARTLRELGFGLDDVCRVLDGRITVAEIAGTHVAAIDAQIRSLRVSRTVLSMVSKSGSTTEETALMNSLARLSTAERLRIVDDFKDEVFGHLEPALRERIRDHRIDLPDEPTPDQLDAWVELAELVQDPEFRSRMRTFVQLGTPTPDQPRPPGANLFWARQAVELAAEARERGTDPAEVLAQVTGAADPAAVLVCLEAGIAAQAERYRMLTARIRGGSPSPDATAELEWLAAALRDSVRSTPPPR